MKVMNRIAFSLSLAAALSTQVFAEDDTRYVSRYGLTEVKIPVEKLDGDFLCLEYCVEMVVEKVRFECNPVVAPPTSGCPLPWIDFQRPSPVPGLDPMDWCIPEEPELIGFELHEDRSLVKRTIKHSGCTTEVTDSVTSSLPDKGHLTRACPDAVGPWNEESEQIHSIRFSRCN